ncbi:MAG: hypothetical protein KGJ80_14140 [Chloroflexota bacterium]|nr:hypothetical protein [Chloroflexota bacterium]
MIAAFNGLPAFLMVSLILFVIPFVLCILVLLRQRWAYRLSILYAGIMVVNGGRHYATTVITGKYFDGCAGGSTGIGFAILGTLADQ